ncbi:STAS domain-containing protein [Streptomyces pseudovenezuelae]|uniref:STAS domain-containing protein n=1 Tax=Streptomyces pseudovenezuelae TaxID=67350 RepID=UPI0036E1DF20
MSTTDDSQSTFGQVNVHVPEQTGLVQYERDEACVIVTHGAFDMDTIAPLAEALQTAASKHNRVVVEASDITFADSTFLNLLLQTSQQTDLRLVAPRQQLRRVLEMTGADKVITVQSTVDEATT